MAITNLKNTNITPEEPQADAVEPQGFIRPVIIDSYSKLIKVYDSDEKLFATNGIKILHPLKAEVTKVDNGDYYCEFKDTIENLPYYQKGMIIRVPTRWGVQGFRCDNPTITNKKVECKAWHLTYDAKNYLISDSYAVDSNCNVALAHFNSATDIPSPFTTTSDITDIMSTRAVRQSLFDVFEWLASDEKYNGHWYRNNWTLGINKTIGEDRGVVLSYEKNISEIQVEEDWSEVCTKILPYTTDGEVAITLDSTYVELSETLYDIPYSQVVQFENELDKEDYETEEAYTQAVKTQLQAQAEAYLQEHCLPKVNYSVNAVVQDISDVGDTIRVKHPKCNVDIMTSVISVVYDAIKDRYIKIELGNYRNQLKNISDRITAEVKKYTDVTLKETASMLGENLKQATARINEVLGNSYVIYEGDKILVVDRLPKEIAVNVIKISNGGIGFSNTGINGTFNSAWTIDGTLDMSAVNVMNLTANMIKGGVLELGRVDNQSGWLEIYDSNGRLLGKMDKDGIRVNNVNTGDYVLMNAEVGFSGYNKNGVRIYWADGDTFHMRNAEVENKIKIAGKIQLVPVDIQATETDNAHIGVGFVAIS